MVSEPEMRYMRMNLLLTLILTYLLTYLHKGYVLTFMLIVFGYLGYI